MKAIEVDQLWKQYRYGTVGYGTLRQDLQSWWAGVRGREDPNRQIHLAARQQPLVGGHERFWALENVSFSVDHGEVVGVIGRNGAGKSTLLKVLSRVTSPTRGELRLRGRVASLLEVGTGFHPDLTGRENVYLNGAILGMRRGEVRRKLDEIVEFAGIGQFLDTPVKRYSSGMYLRLAFSVAAHLDTEILFIDEILAVGDTEFQRKCLGKVDDVAKGGRAVLFVSHNLAAVGSLCARVLLLSQGQVAFDGEAHAGLRVYEDSTVAPQSGLDVSTFRGPLRGSIAFERLELRQHGRPVERVDPESALEVLVEGRAAVEIPSYIALLALFRDGARLFECRDSSEAKPLPAGRFESSWTLPGNLFQAGRYTIGVGGLRPEGGDWLWSSEAATFDVVHRGVAGPAIPEEGLLKVQYTAARRALPGRDAVGRQGSKTET